MLEGCIAFHLGVLVDLGLPFQRMLKVRKRGMFVIVGSMPTMSLRKPCFVLSAFLVVLFVRGR